MSVALYEFPLCEKVRNYLRLEQLFAQLNQAKSAQTDYQYLHFLEVLFNIMDLVERLDLRTDFLRDIDTHERKLKHWSQHPDIDTQALELALQKMSQVGSEIKKNKKLGSSLRDERFLVSIRQRFAIPGGATAFDLPSLFCWLKQEEAPKKQDVEKWSAHLFLIESSLILLLSFLREKSRFNTLISKNGFYQGTAEDKVELVRIQFDNSMGMYPVVSGSRNRYGIKFMKLNPEPGNSGAVTGMVEFMLACC